MAAPTYRYLAYDLVSLAMLGELPLSNVSWTQVLNGAGAFSAEMPLNVPRQTSAGVYASKATELLSATTTGRSLVVVERNGQFMDAYILWTRTYDSQTQRVNLAGKSIWSYFEHRLITTTTIFSATDQLALVRSLINTAQAVGGGNINITVGSETSGVLRDRQYWYWDYKPVAEAVQELAQASNGFDFAVYVTKGVSAPTFTFALGYPSLGRQATDTGIVFEAGRNLISFAIPEDSQSQANAIYVLGAGDGGDMLRGFDSSPELITAGYPLLETVVSFRDEKVIANLNNTATGLKGARSQPVTIPTFRVRSIDEQTLGSWIMGDYATFYVGSNPDKPDPRFPTRTQLVRRIVGQTVNVGDVGQETVDLVVN